MASKIGDLKVKMKKADGTTQTAVISGIKYAEQVWVKLLSIPVLLSQGYNLSNNGMKIVLTNKDTKIEFDKIIKTNDGFLNGIDMEPIKTPEEMAFANVCEPYWEKKEIGLRELHEKLGHPNQTDCKRTAKHYSLKTRGKKFVCMGCAHAKARHKKQNRALVEKADKPGYRMFLDVSSVRNPCLGGKKHIGLFLDDYSDFAIGHFLSNIEDLSKEVFQTILHLKESENIKVERIRCDNADENFH